MNNQTDSQQKNSQLKNSQPKNSRQTKIRNKHIKFYNSISFKLTVIVFLSFAVTNLISSGILNQVERPRVEGFMEDQLRGKLLDFERIYNELGIDVYKRQNSDRRNSGETEGFRCGPVSAAEPEGNRGDHRTGDRLLHRGAE